MPGVDVYVRCAVGHGDARTRKEADCNTTPVTARTAQWKRSKVLCSTARPTVPASCVSHAQADIV